MGVSKGRGIAVTRKLIYKHWFDRAVPIGLANLEAGTPMALANAISPGTPMAPGTDPIMFMLPSGINTWEKSSFRSLGYINMPSNVCPLEAEKEAEVLLQLIKELNMNFCLELSDDIEVADKCWVSDPVNEGDKVKKFILVVCKHMARLALAMEDAGHVPCDWRALHCDAR
jgi:hypothetical protein